MIYVRSMGTRSMMFIIWLTISTVMLLPGCGSAEYNLLFSAIKGLKKGAPLLFEQNTIGTVKKIVYTKEGDYLVSLSVDKAFASAMTEYSRFEVVPSPVEGVEKAIVMTLEQKGGTPLEKEVAIKALEPSRFLALDKMTPMLKKLESGVDQFINDLQNIPESEQFKTFEKKFEDTINELGRQMKNSGKDIQDNIQDNIIPRLEKELEELRRKFEQNGDAEKIEPLEKKLNDLKDV